MVPYLRPPGFHALHQRPAIPAFCSRISVAGFFAIFLLFLVACIPLVSAEDCGNTEVAFTSALATAGPYPTTVEFRAQANNCPNCHWQWTISRADNAVPEVKYYNEWYTYHAFNWPGRYLVDVMVYTTEGCPAYKGTSHDQREIEITGPPLGYAGACLYVDGGEVTPREERGEIGISPEFLVSSPNCINCRYLWLVREVDYPDDGSRRYAILRDISLDAGDVSSYRNNQRFAHNFREPGTYEITSIIKSLLSCPEDLPGQWISGSQKEAVAYYRVSAPYSSHGVNGICDDPGPVEVNQIWEYSNVGSSPVPYWNAEPAFTCRDCVYTWSIWKMQDTFIPIPLDNTDLISQNGKTTLQHSFREPGDYKIYVRVENPPECPITGSDRPYPPASVIHHVLPQADAPSQSTADAVSPVPKSSKAEPSLTVTATLSPQVTYTVIPGESPRAVPLPQDTRGQIIQPAGTPAPGYTGTINPASGAAPGVTTVPLGGSGSVAPQGTTRAPGFGFSLALCAGLLFFILRRK